MLHRVLLGKEEYKNVVTYAGLHALHRRQKTQALHMCNEVVTSLGVVYMNDT